MLSIKGIYTGNEIKPLEEVHARPNVRVIITFLDDDAGIGMGQKDSIRNNYALKSPTQVFLEKCGGWEDTLSPAEIITEIYATRTTSDRGGQLFRRT